MTGGICFLGPAAGLVLSLGLATCRFAVPSQRLQVAATVSPKFQYEVASIKPHDPAASSNGVFSRFSQRADGLSASNVTLLSLIESAYNVEESRVLEIPGWLKSETYDLEAKMDDSTFAVLDALPQAERNAARAEMLQSLLADRLKLRIHRETRELPVYELVVAKNGPKLLPEDLSTNLGQGLGAGSDANGNSRINAKAVTLDALARFLSGRLHRMVLNKTGLTDRYQFTLNYFVDPNLASSPATVSEEGRETVAPPASLPGATGRSLFDAIQEQLGLKLVSAKGPVEIIVIDHIEHLTPN